MKNKKLISFYGKIMLDLAIELYPINRSITGDGLRKSLNLISRVVPLKKKKIYIW
jgi:aminopeptidase-like protein